MSEHKKAFIVFVGLLCSGGICLLLAKLFPSFLAVPIIGGILLILGLIWGCALLLAFWFEPQIKYWEEKDENETNPHIPNSINYSYGDYRGGGMMKSFRLSLPKSKVGKVITVIIAVWFGIVLFWLLLELLAFLFPSLQPILEPLLSKF